jgi:hypothetical protein
MKSDTWISDIAKPHGHVAVPIEAVNPDLLDWFEDRGMYLKNADIFCSPPNFTLGIHVDGVRRDNAIATNWAYETKNTPGIMQWWEPKPEFVNPSDLKPEEHGAYSISTTPYALAWLPEQCNLLHESVVGNPSLVNIGIPHSMTNGRHQRYAISMTWKNFNGVDMQWDEAYERILG